MILCIKTKDLRFKTVSEYLSTTNDVIYDIKYNPSNKIETIILPVQGITADGYISGTDILFSKLIESIKPKKIFTGLLNNNIVQICSMNDIKVITYLSESVSYKNTLLTSEGLLKVLYNKELTLSNKNILITGYGRLTANLCNILDALRANITIYARKEKDRVSAKLNGYNSIENLDSDELRNFDIVINTVPHVIFTENNRNYFKDNTTFIDIASNPGGYDKSYSNVIQELGIPGRIYPYESGLEIAKYIGDQL